MGPEAWGAQAVPSQRRTVNSGTGDGLAGSFTFLQAASPSLPFQLCCHLAWPDRELCLALPSPESLTIFGMTNGRLGEGLLVTFITGDGRQGLRPAELTAIPCGRPSFVPSNPHFSTCSRPPEQLLATSVMRSPCVRLRWTLAVGPGSPDTTGCHTW